jgi:hypothetical protein
MLKRLAGHKGMRLGFDDSALYSDHGGMGSIVGSQFGQDVLDAAFYGFFRNGKLRGNLLVGVSTRD